MKTELFMLATRRSWRARSERCSRVLTPFRAGGRRPNHSKNPIRRQHRVAWRCVTFTSHIFTGTWAFQVVPDQLGNPNIASSVPFLSAATTVLKHLPVRVTHRESPSKAGVWVVIASELQESLNWVSAPVTQYSESHRYMDVRLARKGRNIDVNLL